MIVDTFLFGWELDLLRMRLIEMDPFVDLFVLIESDQTFQGEPKPFYYQDNVEQFSSWSHKILVVHPKLPETTDPWLREHLSRESAKDVINKLPQDAIILHGDVDEIMSRKLGPHLNKIVQRNEIYSLDQKQYSMAIDWLYPMSWQGTVFARQETIKSMSMLDVRSQRIYGQKMRDGWHFTWLGGKEFISRKAQSFSHTEDEIQSYIKDMGERLYTEGFHVRGEKLIPVDVDDSYPEYIRLSHCPIEWYRPR